MIEMLFQITRYIFTVNDVMMNVIHVLGEFVEGGLVEEGWLEGGDGHNQNDEDDDHSLISIYIIKNDHFFHAVHLLM